MSRRSRVKSRIKIQISRPISSKNASSKVVQREDSDVRVETEKSGLKTKVSHKELWEREKIVIPAIDMNAETDPIAVSNPTDATYEATDTETEMRLQSDESDTQTTSNSILEQAPEGKILNFMPNDDKMSEDDENLLIQMEDDPNEQESSVDNSEVDFCTEQNCITCNVCEKSFESAFSLAYHMKQHNLNNQIHKCLVCSKILSSASSLDRHMLVHSGERPFKCKLCDMAFTTNGNMHRHMRTHTEYTDVSDTSKIVDLRKKDFVKKKLLLDPTIRPSSPQEAAGNSVIKVVTENLTCPVCSKTFSCKYSLECHMEKHPNDSIVCQSCHEVSSNYDVYVKHKCSMLTTETHPYVSVSCGFQDLNFVDFSTEKFSLISKLSCEQTIKRPSSAFHVFNCSTCNKAFPCERALKLHMNVHNKIGTFCSSCKCNFGTSAFLQLHQLKHKSAEHYILQNHSTNANRTESALHAEKEDFLAMFDLQTKESQSSLLKEIKASQVKEGNFENMNYFIHGAIKKEDFRESEETDSSSNNDFADIQSIISLTSRAPLINAVQTLPVAAQPTSPLNMTVPHRESPLIADSANASPQTPSTDSAVQPLNAKNVPNISDTMTNGYSCSTCSQKFRNINALKRHSKLHVQRSCNYSCHLCRYTSVDKSTLIRHLRTHNGERPFQCTICKYAFTTKANCERHVKKRHKKLTKPEIRNFMQYNPNMSLKAPSVSSADIGSSETVCKYCNVDFKFNRVLRHHLRSLHNSCNRKPFSCRLCNFGFSTKNNCIRHVLKQHPAMKDELRSTVILNTSKDVSEMSGTESDNNLDFKATSLTMCPPPPEQAEPLNLNCNNQTEFSNMHSDATIKEITSNEAVIAAESLVSLSETFLSPDEPLDLVVRPLDLSLKPESAVINKCSTSIENLNNLLSIKPQKPCKFISLPASTTFVLVPEITASIIHDNSTISCSTQTKSAFSNVINAKREKLRSFTCVYCSAGFTLKSNMERHIKRKHPEYAKPTRSRNFISSVIAHRSQRQNINMLSDRTRDALRHVLNNKVQQNPIYTGHVMAPDIYGRTKSSDDDNDSGVNKDRIEDNCCDTFGQTIDLSERSAQFNASNMNNASLSKAGSFPEDDNSIDLASVSSVICTANSQHFQQYFEKPTPDKSTSKDEEALEGNESIRIKKDISTKVTRRSSVCCPFCSCKFPWSSSLRRHILTHTGQKPYKCSKCVLSFTTKSNCERHLIRKHGHKGDLISRSVPDRPFKCIHCASSTFSTQGNLRKHFYLKHWTKSCRGMNTRNINKSNERAKILTTINEHSYSQTEEGSEILNCDFCEEIFDELSHLAKHMENHNSVKYICYLCRKNFLKSGTCFNHFKTTHSSVDHEMLQSNSESYVMPFLQQQSNAEKISTGFDDSALTACMICFKKISNVEELHHHLKVHSMSSSDELMSDAKTENSCPSTTDAKKKTVATLADKKYREKNKVKNSLLYLLNPTEQNPLSSDENLETKEISSQKCEEGSDLIQNLLGIHDSRIIDAMLVSADSAARLLGVKKM